MVQAAAMFLAGAHAGAAADGKEHAILKHPRYKAEQQWYCRLTFVVPGDKDGGSAVPVWAVLDGDDLYLDLNGNRNLNEAGERFRSDKRRATTMEFTDNALRKRFTKLHARWAAGPEQVLLHFSTLVDGRYRLETIQDKESLAATEEKAPVVRFGGPLEISITGKPTFRFFAGNNARTILPLFAAIGTKSDTNHSAVVLPSSIPEDAHPVARISYPPLKDGGERVVDEVDFERVGDLGVEGFEPDGFSATATVSQKRKPGSVTIEVRMEGWDQVQVRPASTRTKLPEFKDLPRIDPDS
jgi:hypothetical protein